MPHPRLHHRLTGCLAAAALLALGPGLAGCSPDSANPTDKHGEPSTTTSTTPNTDARSDFPFDSDEEALKAAKEVYSNYLRVASEIMNEGGNDVDRIDEFAIDSAQDEVVSGAERLRDEGKTYEGGPSFYNLSLSDHVASSGDVLVATVCTDVTDVEVFDADGNSTLAENRDPLMPMVLHFTTNQNGNLVLSRRVDQESNACD